MITIDKPYFKNWKFIDLFAGLGGFRLALESLGAECVYSNEWDIPAQEVYYENFGDVPEGDITKVDETTIPDHDIYVQVFLAKHFLLVESSEVLKIVEEPCSLMLHVL